jgi:D-beta-D-heptose 7-phosphate kinase/D-beta-D-heptose 1-phosphate adenosyltransferase
MTGRRPHVVVVGDLVLDTDVDGRSDRLCPDAPVPVVDVSGTRQSPGGAGLTALLCAASGVRVTLVAPVADDHGGWALRDGLAPHVDLVALGHDGPTRRKTRVRSAGQSVVRVDDGGPGSPVAVPEEALRQVLATADVVLVSDYGAGMTRDRTVRTVLAEVASRRPVVWDPHPRGGRPVPGVALATPNLAEAQAAAADVLAPPGGVPDRMPADVLAGALCSAWRARAVSVTAGPAGAFLAAAGTEPLFSPAVAVSGGDPCGAGDRFAASAAVALATGALVSEAVTAAVADASLWVAQGGADGYRRRMALAGAGTGQQSRGAAWSSGGGDGFATLADLDGTPAPRTLWAGVDDVAALAARLRTGGGTLVATGGCFDIVHAGHVATLQAARRLGDALVVLLNSDESVRRLKGDGRPVVGAADRARVLAAFDCVDAVVVFDQDEPTSVLADLRPDVWAKGGDYDGTRLPEADVVRSAGGRIVLLPYLGGHSTTSIIERSGTSRAPQDQTTGAGDP